MANRMSIQCGTGEADAAIRIEDRILSAFELMAGSSQPKVLVFPELELDSGSESL
jgi:hypothetical protein